MSLFRALFYVRLSAVAGWARRASSRLCRRSVCPTSSSSPTGADAEEAEHPSKRHTDTIRRRGRRGRARPGGAETRTRATEKRTSRGRPTASYEAGERGKSGPEEGRQQQGGGARARASREQETEVFSCIGRGIQGGEAVVQDWYRAHQHQRHEPHTHTEVGQQRQELEGRQVAHTHTRTDRSATSRGPRRAAGDRCVSLSMARQVAGL